MSIVQTLAGKLAKVDGDPKAIRNIAAGLRAVGDHVSTSMNRLPRYVSEVGKAWRGASAEAFASYMAAYPKAGNNLKGALTTCASALDEAAGKLESAHNTITNLHSQASAAQTAYKNKHPDATAADIDRHVASALQGDPVKQADDAIRDAQDAVASAKKALGEQLGEGFTFFKGIPQPDGADFKEGTHKVDWRKIGSYNPTTTLASTGNPGGLNGPGDGGPGGGGSGGGGGGAGAPSSYGNAPAPKAQVVEWIKQALTIIKSPEMAAIMRQRGLDVSDLDPNDPKDIQRIWTIIYHESGGNPNAINNWDINAKNGVPSQGLMQTIPPTFNAHALPGYGQIREPVDNIIAGVLYTYSRYGNLAGHPGISSLERGGGYRPY
ncbi:transglycosylase SLT domain-containing protein [Nonomuraea sp. SYSU D8015]|uniref:transglycosylase SLT domain-containing protein n=1 Tax=Nonomuraea sp. SYSU D8015 TaxID=2593644 RepID=UPI00166083FC|nr:transglycosylase SLT domain-containing protein [Nonomuraea sp. SYSU D8015]